MYSTLKKLFKKSNGFTLIEMLVVVAIIGILAGMILIVLGAAREKAKDARIIHEMSQIRNAAAVYYNSQVPINYNFDSLSCEITDHNIKAICDDIADQGGIKPSDGVTPGVDIFTDNAQLYCAAVKLNLGAYWCVDSAGRSARYDGSTSPTEPDCTNVFYSCE